MTLKTAMWNEIHDQTEVCRTLLAEYLPRAEAFRALLQKKKNLILTGTGASLYACQMAKYMFYRYSGLLPTVLPVDELHYILHQVDADTLIIFVSQSGESYETKLVSGILKAHGIDFWGITNEPQSHLAQNASEVLLLHCGREVSSATKTNTATFLLLSIAAGGYDAALAAELTALPEKIEKTFFAAAKTADAWAELLAGQMQLYILGTGVNAATAVEGALMMKEKTFIHTAGSSVSDFRHGTVEVIEPGLPIVLLGSGEEMNEQLRQHANYFASLGVQVFVVTDLPDAYPDTYHVAGVQKCAVEELSPMLQVIPLQLLAEAVARRKGLDVDGFRFLSKVVGEYHTEGCRK